MLDLAAVIANLNCDYNLIASINDASTIKLLFERKPFNKAEYRFHMLTVLNDKFDLVGSNDGAF